MNLNQVHQDLKTYVSSHGGNKPFLQKNEMFEGVLANYYYISAKWIQPYSSGAKIILPNTALSVLEWEFERATLFSVSCQTFAKLQDNLQQKLRL
ncbi:hypothetical protein [Laspinema olomoucense]|uniref:hypothetical protein n=1 Tax=Laspinema olomoucense TaxID=3231600 RepID=UPI0021BAFEC8|nr:hypothetical protein [Laspinema sp. D3d]MCT7971250.1 hypothetical protein [Laspinema sp. D3d]